MSVEAPKVAAARRAPARPSGPRAPLGHNAILAVTLVALLLLFRSLVGPGMLSVGALQAMAFQMPEFGILSLAMMVSLLSGGLNLSIIAAANLCALTIAFTLARLLPGAEGVAFGAALALSVAAGLGVAALVGAVNGFVIAYLGVSPILTTLGVMTLCKGLSVGLTHGGVLSGFPAPIVFLGNGSVYGVPAALIAFALCAAPLAVALQRTAFGVRVAMIGSNERATRFSGVDTRATILKVYVLSSVLAGVAGVVMMARFNSANASYGESYLLVTILACVLGGVDPYGGFGRVGGVVLALFILQTISLAFNLLNFSQFLTLAIWGAILVLVTGLALRRGARR